jgi:hypothetical protein
MHKSIIRPGLLVSFRTSIKGGVSYQQTILEADHMEGASRLARWETKRQITDAEEHQAAQEARNKVRTLICGACCQSSFGYLCPEANVSQLEQAVEAAQSIVDEHNGSARYTRVELFVLTGRIADSDDQAARAIGSEVRDLIDAMERGVKGADAAAIRDAANRAKRLSGMLSAEARESVSAAIDEVRAVARDIVKRVEKAGEAAATVVDAVTLDAVQAARFACLDMEAAGEGVRMPSAGRAIDLAPAPDADADAPHDTKPQGKRGASSVQIDL